MRPDLNPASFVVLALWFTVAGGPARGAEEGPTGAPAPAPASANRVAYEMAKEAGPLAAVAELERRRGELAEGNLESHWLDVVATWRIFVGDHRGALEAHSLALESFRGGRGAGGPGGEALDGLVAKPAVDAILAMSEGRRVLMLNEEHRSGRERAFAHELLEPLARAGFTHLALETLADRAADLEARGYPLEDDGYYTRDPVLGDLVRRAIALGMGIVAYEADMSLVPDDLDPRDPVARTNWREAQQARNLAAVLEADAEARVVVWSGRHHMSEDPPPSEASGGEADAASGGEAVIASGGGSEGGAPRPPVWTPMGGIFARRTGIDPLTVDLMMMTEGATPRTERPAYRSAVERGLVPEPVIFFDAQGAPWSPIDSIDAAVFFPRTRWDDTGRPTWLAMGGVRRRVAAAWSDLTDEAPAKGRPLVVEAAVVGEDERAVPLDRVIWREGAAPALYLRPGASYALRLRDARGRIVARGPAPLQVER